MSAHRVPLLHALGSIAIELHVSQNFSFYHHDLYQHRTMPHHSLIHIVASGDWTGTFHRIHIGKDARWLWGWKYFRSMFCSESSSEGEIDTENGHKSTPKEASFSD